MADRKPTFAFLAINPNSMDNRIEWYEEVDGVLVKTGRATGWTGLTAENDADLLKGKRNELKFTDDNTLATATPLNSQMRMSRWTRKTTGNYIGVKLATNTYANFRLALYGTVTIFHPTIASPSWDSSLWQHNASSTWYSGSEFVFPIPPDPTKTGAIVISNDGKYGVRLGLGSDSYANPSRELYFGHDGLTTNWEDGMYRLAGPADADRFVSGTFSQDSSTLVAITDDYRVFTWSVSFPDAPVLLGTEALGGTHAGTPWRVAASQKGDVVAFSFQIDAATYATKVYKRTGGTYELKNEITGNFGRYLDLTLDGKYLIDCSQRRAFDVAKDGTVTENATLMQNLMPAPDIYRGQAISPDMVPPPSPMSASRMYPNGLEALTTGQLNLDGLKMMLLSSGAAFDGLATDMTGLAAHEVSGNGWPAGGLTLTGRTVSTFGRYHAYSYDDPVQTLSGDLTFKSLVIYDSTAGVPLAWSEFPEEVVGASGEDLTFDLAGYGLLVFDT